MSSKKKYVASSSLDGFIKIWNISKNLLIKEYNCFRGVLMISYMNSCLLSIGFYNFINVWNAEINGNVPFLGKLNGHMNLVVFCKFLNSNLNALSMDERNHLRIWDVREMSTL